MLPKNILGPFLVKKAIDSAIDMVHSAEQNLPSYACHSKNSNDCDIKGYVIIKKANEIIKSGVIFCLKLKEDKIKESGEKLEKLNPISPYFLAYVYDNGEIKYQYTNIKNILEIYKMLCHGKKEAYEELCNIFNEKTDNGSNMEHYSDLLHKMVDSIKGKSKIGRAHV